MIAAQILIVASAAIILALGCVHLLYTFHGDRLHPRDAVLMAKMQTESPVLTRKTTMWRAWVGFNASHSYGAMLFGLVYGYLALFHMAMLSASAFLLALGMVLLLAYGVLGRLYWFSVPYRGIVVSALLYAAGLVLIHV
jgi:hypothetical protein